MYIVKLNSSGTLLWSRTIGGTGNDDARSIIQSMDGGFVVAGRTQSFGSGNNDVFVVKLDANGNTCGNSTSPTSIVTKPIPQVTTPTPSVIDAITGVSNPSSETTSGGTATNICIVGIELVSNEIPNEFRLHQNYPNPFNPETVIEYDIPELTHAKLIVFDLNGREVMELVNEELKPGSYKIEFDGNNLSSGIYFYKLETDYYSLTMKMVLLK
jgi:hypothetical protein